MQNNAIAQKAIEEVLQQNFGVTEQFLQVHQLVYKDGQPEIILIDDISRKDAHVIYFAVKEEKFYLAVVVETSPEVAVRWVYTEDYHSVYFSATSGTLNATQLVTHTILIPTESWNKGDSRKFYKNQHKTSAVIIRPHDEPGEFEAKLDKLLDILERDKQGIITLSEKADTSINVISIYHNGNTMLGGPVISRNAIKRLAALNLEIGFDNYAEGNFFTD